MDLSAKQRAWLTESKRRVAVMTQALRDRASAEVRAHAPGTLPPSDRVERFYLDRGTCKTCGRNLQRTESMFRECWRCEESPAPLASPYKAKGPYGF